MNMSGSREIDDVSILKRPKIHASLYECDNQFNANDTNDVDELLKSTKPPQKGIGKCASLPSFVYLMSPEVGGIEMELHRIWSSGSLQSPHSCSVSLPTQSKLVSALKGSREKHGISQKKLSVTWAPNVYDPFPTSLACMIRSKKQRKSNKNNDKKKIGKKGHKGNKSSRGSAGGKDIKQFRGNNGSSYRWYKQLVVEDSIVNTSHRIDDFNINRPDPWSPTGEQFSNTIVHHHALLCGRGSMSMSSNSHHGEKSCFLSRFVSN